MAQAKNLCVQIPLEFHNQVYEAREQSDLTTAQYITKFLTKYFKMKMRENGGNTTMTSNTRTIAFRIPEELFQRVKAHLERESIRTVRKYTQREFVLGLIEEALNEAERLVARETSQTSEEASVGTCETTDTEDEAQPPEKP